MRGSWKMKSENLEMVSSATPPVLFIIFPLVNDAFLNLFSSASLLRFRLTSCLEFVSPKITAGSTHLIIKTSCCRITFSEIEFLI